MIDTYCPNCSGKWDGKIGGRPYTVIQLEKDPEVPIKGFHAYVCPKCGFTEFYKDEET